MKQTTLHISELGAFVVSTLVISSDEDGGSAIPLFGKDALRAALLYLEELSQATIADDVTHTRMVQDGRPFEHLALEREQAMVAKTCAHEWKDVNHPLVINGEQCQRCGMLRPKGSRQ